MSAACRLAETLAHRLTRRPTLRARAARAVMDEDALTLARLLTTLGLDADAASVERLLDAPGPFAPRPDGWT